MYPTVVHIGVETRTLTFDDVTSTANITLDCRVFTTVNKVSHVPLSLFLRNTEISLILTVYSWGGDSSVADQKISDSVRVPAGVRYFFYFFSRVSAFCDNVFRYPLHPRVTAVARKRSLPFCKKCSWQVTAKHATTLCMWLCMK